MVKIADGIYFISSKAATMSNCIGDVKLDPIAVLSLADDLQEHHPALSNDLRMLAAKQIHEQFPMFKVGTVIHYGLQLNSTVTEVTADYVTFVTPEGNRHSVTHFEMEQYASPANTTLGML